MGNTVFRAVEEEDNFRKRSIKFSFGKRSILNRSKKRKEEEKEKIESAEEEQNNNKTEQKVEDTEENKYTFDGKRISLVAERVIHYCIPLIEVEFAGQSNTKKNDQSDEDTVLNLGLYLSLLDKVIRKYKNVSEFTINDEEYVLVLRVVATKRKHADESADECFDRLWNDSKIFQTIYHSRGELSEQLGTAEFWGTRQQLMCGKVIADWVDTSMSPFDPIFGALLCPCGGRVGPGDSGWVHNLLYDNTGYMAYHAAVHDAFGYLITFHSSGPGYNYLEQSVLNKHNPLSGQYDGISFWKDFLEQIFSSGEYNGTRRKSII